MTIEGFWTGNRLYWTLKSWIPFTNRYYTQTSVLSHCHHCATDGSRYITPTLTAQKTPLPPVVWARLLTKLLPSNGLVEPFPSNGCICWLHVYSFQQTCYNTAILKLQDTLSVYVIDGVMTLCAYVTLFSCLCCFHLLAEILAVCWRLWHFKYNYVYNVIHCFKWERREGDKGMKRIEERKKRGEGWRYESNYSPLIFNGIFHQLTFNSAVIKLSLAT